MKEFMTKNFEEFIAAILIVVTTLLVLMNVFFRYFLHTGIYWSEEVATSCFVWSIFIGAAGAYRQGAQLGIDLLVKKLPETARKIVQILVQIVLILINVFIVYLSVQYIQHTYTIKTSVLAVSSAWVSASIPVGFGLTSVYSVLGLWRMIRGFGAKEGKEG